MSAAIGDDATGDGTSGNPYATISKANEIAGADFTTGTIYVAAGTYAELVTTPRQNIRYVGTNAIIDGGGVRNGFNILHRDCEVSGFEIDNAVIGIYINQTINSIIATCSIHNCSSYGLRVEDCAAITVKNTVSHTNGNSGFNFQNSSDMTVFGCEAYGQTTGSAAFYAQACDTVVWYNNYAHDNTGIYGFEIEEGSDNAIIRDCWSEANSIGFICKTSDATLFLRNVAWGNASYGIYFKGGQNGFVYHCDVYNNLDGIALLWDDITGDFSIGNTVKNNIISGNGGYALRFDVDSQTGFESDYNDFYNNSTSIGNWGGVNQATLAAWQSASSQGANSLTLDPDYATVVKDGFIPNETDLLSAGDNVGYGTRLGHTQ